MTLHAITRLAIAGLLWSLATSCGAARMEAESGQPGDDAEGAGQGEVPVEARLRWHAEQAGLRLIEGDEAGALDYYLEGGRLCESRGLPTVECADMHYEAAGIAYRSMDRELAIAEYRKAVDIYLRFTGNARAKAAVSLNSIGVMYREMADKTAARNAFEQALQIYRDTPDEFKSRANIQKIEQNIRALDEGYH